VRAEAGDSAMNVAAAKVPKATNSDVLTRVISAPKFGLQRHYANPEFIAPKSRPQFDGILSDVPRRNSTDHGIKRCENHIFVNLSRRFGVRSECPSAP
jgi:hypothetical protein